MRKKLNNWRAAYRRERKKIEESLTTASEPDEYHKPNLWYYDYLTFLHDDCPVLSKDDGDDDVGNDDTRSDNDEEGVVDDNIIEEGNSEEEVGSNPDDANDSEPEQSDKEYYVEIRVKALEQNNASSKYQNCTGTLNIDGDGQILVKECQCADFPENLEELVIDATTVDGPIQLENEVQTENISTSGEQFIAVPRDKPAPCIGCATIVDPAASGVHELATLGVRQLDRHEPNTRHALNNVLLVERQVQVVGGVRYIMTLTIDYDNCTTNESNDCIVQKTCRISVLEKPWQKLPDGSKFRAIVSNNCTDEWLFGENGPSEPNLNNQSNDIGNPTSQYDPTGVGDDIVKAIHNVEVHAQPATEKVLTEYQIKELEEQIIPNVKVDQTTNNVVSGPTQMPITEVKFTTLDAAKPIEHIPSKHLEINKIEPGLPEDKKKTIDELINFFDFAGFKDKEVHDEIIRMKRDYGSDLKMLNVAENYQDMKTKLKNAQFIKKLALVMVNHINEMDIEARTRVFKEVISAEEETEKDQRYFYIKARVSLPCDKPVCKNEEFNICDGIIDVSGEQPSVLYTVCNAKPKINLGKLKNVPEKDPILLKFLKRALTKIDVESKNPYALRIRNILSATTQRVSGTLTKITVEIEYTECFKSVPLLKRKNCTALENLGYKVCDIEVVERHWLKESKLTYTCTDRPVDEMFVSVPHQLNLDDPKIHEVVQEALQNLELKSNRNNKQKLIEVKSVSTKQVAGVLINVVFTVGYTTCPSEFKDDVNTCELLENEPLRKCSVEVWERAWLDEERRRNISCEELSINVDSKIDSIQKIDSKKSMQTTEKEIVKDPSEYSKLADDCLTNYIATYGINQHYKVVKMHTVVKENVSSDLTTIDFEAAPTNCTAKNGYPTSSSCSVQGSAETLSCHAEVMTNPQLNTRMMKVNCLVNTKEFRRKREVLVGGKTTQDPKNPRYMELAERSLTKYVRKTRKSQYHKVVTIQEVKTQVVSGIKTIIQFKASPTNCEADRSGMSKGNSQLCVIEDSSVVLSCFADIYEQPWMGKEEIDVSCHPDRSRVKRDVSGSKSDQRRLLGGLKEKDVSDPTYTQLAKESLAKYVSSTGSTDEHTVIKINKVQTQVVAGTKTIIDFTVQGPAKVFECHSKVWEQPWLNKKEIDVKCDLTNTRQKRQVPGGPVDQDVTDPKYKQLAEESLAKYVSTTGSNEQHKVIEIKKVHTQVVSGKMTIIDFTVQGPANVFECHSKVWEQPWLNKKEIDVKCDLTNTRQKRQVPGGPVDQDVTDPKYKQLAEESLAKYVSTTGSNEQHKVIEIKKVHTQVVSGKMTIIDFTVQGPANVFECHSKVWEQPWLNKKEIDVKCNPTVSRQKRQVPGGPVDQDVTDPKYKQLAEESLAKYVSTTGSNEQHKVIEIKKVHTQVVSGKMTIIDFTVQGPANVFKCHSKVWEQPWLNKKEIDVKCDPTNKRQKRQVPGGPVDQDVTDPTYKQLAEESLAKYVSTTGSNEQHKVIEIKKVQTQVVSGKKTIIDFTVQGPGNVFECNSEVWEQPWLKKKDITVKCSPVQLRHRREVQLLSVVRNINRVNNVHSTGRKSGGQKEEDPTEPKYAALATEALRRFEKRKRSQYFHKVVTVDHVVTQVVSGQKILIDFTSSPTTCPSNATNEALCDIITNTTLYCRAEVWDRPWLKKKKINVFCNYENDDEEMDSVENKRKKRSLSNESDLEIKNYIDKSEKTDTPVEVVTGEVEKVPSKKVDNSYLQKEMFYNSKHYLKAAEEALREYEIRSKSDVVYKVVKIHYVNEEDDVGVRARLDFTASPSNCTKTNYTNIDYCEFRDPKELISCHADLRLTMMLDNNMMKNYDVKCIQRKKKKTHSGEMGKVRNIRQMPLDENVEDDLMYYYADRVLSKLNTRFAGDNLYKLITVHDIRRTVHMKTPLVRMYLEVGKTLCLRDDPEVELSTCNEIDGLTHLLCYARVWPSIYDDIVLERTEVVCEDELQKFSPLAGFHTNDLLVVSMYVLNRDGGDRYFLRSVGNPHLSPTLDYNKPFRLSFIVVETNCTKEFVATIDTYSRDILSKCPTNERETLRQCHSQIYITPNSRTLRYVNVSCNVNPKSRTRRSISLNPRNITKEDVTIQKFVQEALQQLEMVSVVKYKQRVLVINRYSTKTAASKQTTIDFDVGYTNCLKYEWVDNITSCEFLEHLPRRHCVAVVTERLWSDNGRQTEVNCEDDETPLEANMELETAQSATTLAKEALKRIEYKYPHPRRQIVVRIFSLDKQMVAGVHYRLKMEVGYSTCMALSEEEDCKLDPLIDQRKFCRVNVWLRSWTNHPPSYRVSCDYQDGAVSEIFHQIQAQELFYHFMARHKPSYLDDHEEMQKRFAIFTQNVKKIHELNVYEMGTARYAVTQHADLTAEEFRKKYLGLDVSLRDENQLPMPEAAIPDVTLPDSFDWRDHDAVTEVKNQGGCGSCWAFSVTGNIEGQWKRHSGKLVSLSEQELVDCDKLDNGCNGGLPDNAYRAIEQLGGLELEADYPYEAEDDKCAFNKTLSRVQISGAVNISSNETNMAKWLVQNGPISIGINANAMQFYVGGISHPWKMLCNPSNLDHGVLIVGYGIKNYPLFNKKLPYWIVKNSWGPTWGEQGYYRVYRGDGTCGVNQMASSAVI
ncbi:hypothetical protein O0L34_g11002 [Tuta absoluta]|nr:hypothetical protein O0L34_g11002 [Tuta absoluta]